MMMVIAIFVVLAVAAALAWTLTARRPEHRPIALQEAQRLERKVDTCVRANTGVRMLAESAILCAQRAEQRASRPVVLVMSPANDDGIRRDEIKKR